MRFGLFAGMAFFLAVSTALAAEPQFRIGGYLPEWNAHEFDFSQASRLTDLFIFSADATPDGGIDMRRLKRTPWDKLHAAAEKDHVRLILCVGGWGRSEAFPTVATSADKRLAFAQAALAICQERKLNGLDLDWEHPKNRAEEEGYGKLIVAIHEAFQPHGLTVSVTMAGWQKLTAEGYQAADYVQVMAYDQRGRHSTFDGAVADVKKVIENGADPAKVILGMPFYGRGVKDANRSVGYDEILAKHRPEPNVDEVDDLYFNGPETIRRKVAYARENKLGGVMVWEVGQDAAGEGSLLRVIHEEATRRK